MAREAKINERAELNVTKVPSKYLHFSLTCHQFHSVTTTSDTQLKNLIQSTCLVAVKEAKDWERVEQSVTEKFFAIISRVRNVFEPQWYLHSIHISNIFFSPYSNLL